MAEYNGKQTRSPIAYKTKSHCKLGWTEFYLAYFHIQTQSDKNYWVFFGNRQYITLEPALC